MPPPLPLSRPFCQSHHMGRAHSFAAGLVAAMCSSSVGWSEPPQDPPVRANENEILAQRYDEEAERLRDAGNLAGAIEASKQALATAHLPIRLFRLGLLYEANCQLPESWEQLTQFDLSGACRNPASSALAQSCRVARERLAIPDTAEAACAKRQRHDIATPAEPSLEPREAAARGLDVEAERFRKAGDRTNAIAAARKALSAAFDLFRLFGLGVLYESNCELPESHEVLSLFVQTDPCLHPTDMSFVTLCEEARARLAGEDAAEAYCIHRAEGSPLDIARLKGLSRGHGRAGNGEFDLGGRGKGATQFIPGNTHVIGGLTADEIGRIVRRHWNEVKYCYEQELPSNPGLTGRVVASLQIGSSGDVIRAVIADTDLHNPSLEKCMLGNIRRWRFPNPRGGGVVEVRYPFVFTPGR